VQLTATPGSGSVFAGWTGACSGTSTCSVTMNADQGIGGTFNGPPTVSVNFYGTGTGTVISTPAAINCPAQCSSTFPSATAVTLKATAGSGSGFDGWSGPCSGTGSCSLNISSDQTVAATFNLPDFSVAVSPSTSPPIPPGGVATFSVAVSALGGFSGAVTLGCSAPSAQGLNCLLSSTSVKPGGSANLTVTTTGPSAALTLPPRTTHSRSLYAVWILFPLAVVGIGSAGLRSKKQRMTFLLFCFCFVLLGLLSLQMACGGGGGGTKVATPAGTYTVNINAASGTTLQHSTSVSINVQ
jgi:hypothetical protein